MTGRPAPPDREAPELAEDGRNGAADGGSVWIDLQDPSDRELEEALEPLRQGRVDAAPEASGRHARLFVSETCVRMTFPTTGAAHFTVYLGERRVVTVHRGTVPELEAIRRQYRRAAEQGRQEPADLALYRVLARVLKEFEREVEDLVGRVEALNLDPHSLHESDVLHQVIGLRRRALGLRRRIDPTVDLFGLLDGRGFPFVRGEHRAFFEDLHERVRGMAGDVDQTRDLLAEDIEAFTSVQSQNVNQIMKVFTVLQAIFLPPTLIASIYGMNFKIPELGWSFGYAYSLGLMAVTVAAMLLYFRHRRWLG